MLKKKNEDLSSVEKLNSLYQYYWFPTKCQPIRQISYKLRDRKITKNN